MRHQTGSANVNDMYAGPSAKVVGLFGAVSITALLLAHPVLAQAVTNPTTPSAAAPAGSSVGEVVVTARKQAENIQDVPLSITAIPSSELSAAGVQDLRDVTFLTPGVNFNSNGANTFEKVIIRGQTDISGTFESNVPIFLDGVYISNPSAIDFGLVDLARIEVIKGPESALYGRSAYAGAINYVTQPPSNTYRGYLDVTAGDFDKFNARGSVSGPIIGDVLTGGVSASYDHFNGTYHDDVTNQNAGGYDKRDVLANLDFKPNEHVEIRPVVYYGQDTFADPASIFAPANCSVGLGYGYSQSFCGKVPNSTFVGPYIAGGGGYGQTGNTREVFESNVQAKLSYEWGTITSLTGYGRISTKEYNEFDDQEYGTPTATYYLPPGATVGTIPTSPALLGALPTGQTVDTPLHFGYTDKTHDFSEELRYSSPDIGPFKFSVGGYYAFTYHYENLTLARGTESVPAGEYIIDPFAIPPGQTASGQHTTYAQTEHIYAGFVTGDYKITNALTASTEIRYAATQENYNDLYAIFDPNPYACLGYSTSCASTPDPIGPGTLSKTFYAVTSRNTLTYKFTPDFLVYVSAANGNKAGGFNNNTTYPTFNPATNWTYEAGVKTTTMDHRLQLDADVYFIDATNYQIYGPPPGATEPGNFITTNYGGLTTPGFEVSGDYIVAPGVDFSAGLAYADPRFKSNAFDFGDVTLCSGIPSCAGRITSVGPNTAVSLAGLRPPYESNWTFNTSLSIRHEIMPAVFLVGRIDYRFESAQFYQYPIDTGYFGPRNVVNLRAGLEKGRWSLVGYVRNLTNDKTPVTVQDAAATGASNFQAGYFPVAVLPDGRNFGVTLRYQFGG